jgi:hypothetical protein
LKREGAEVAGYFVGGSIANSTGAEVSNLAGYFVGKMTEQAVKSNDIVNRDVEMEDLQITINSVHKRVDYSGHHDYTTSKNYLSKTSTGYINKGKQKPIYMGFSKEYEEKR